MAEIKLEAIRKSYGRTEVIHGIDAEIKDGEFIVIVGPSGCGKSTLLRMVAGLETITSGDIHIGDRVVNKLEPRERDIAMVFQNYALYPHMTVFGNMAYGLKIRGMAKAEIQRRVAAAAEILGIGPLLERKPKQLSGGQRQRVAMGRAIVREPALFLFDEPLSNLDAKLRVQMRAEIRRLQRRLGVTSLFVTHDQVEAMTLGDRLVVMNAGRPAQVAPPMEIFSRPADIYVAGFIGSPSMNFIPASLDQGNGSARLADGTLIPFADGPRKGTAGMPITLGLRPEHVEPGDGPGSIQLAVELIEPLGSETVVHGRAPGGMAVTARMPGAFTGDRLPVRLPPAQLHVFDADSGRRLDP